MPAFFITAKKSRVKLATRSGFVTVGSTDILYQAEVRFRVSGGRLSKYYGMVVCLSTVDTLPHHRRPDTDQSGLQPELVLPFATTSLGCS